MRLITFVLVFATAQLSIAADDEIEVQKKLVGVWKGRVHDGATGHELTFTNELISGTKDGERDLGKGSYELDLTTQPWRLDATEITKNGGKGKVWFGNFRLEGDSLTWCVSTKERPTKFETGSGQFMLVLKRDKLGEPKVAKRPSKPLRGADPSQYSVAEFSERAPEALSTEVRETLGKTGLRVAGSDGKVLCEIWFRVGVPLLPSSGAQSETKYPLAPGTLVGAARFVQKGVGDFRDLKIVPGVYTLRYGRQPKDDLHAPTAQFRDFLVLLSAASDTDPAIIDEEDLSVRGIDTTGETHPAFLYLSPPQERRQTLPAMVHTSGSDITTELGILVAKTTAKGNDQIKQIQLELVTVGFMQQ